MYKLVFSGKSSEFQEKKTKMAKFKLEIFNTKKKSELQEIATQRQICEVWTHNKNKESELWPVNKNNLKIKTRKKLQLWDIKLHLKEKVRIARYKLSEQLFKFVVEMVFYIRRRFSAT